MNGLKVLLHIIQQLGTLQFCQWNANDDGSYDDYDEMSVAGPLWL